MRTAFARMASVMVCAIATCALFLVTIRANAEIADESATAIVRQLLVSIGKLRTTTDSVERERLIASIDASLDISKLSRQALGAEWGKLSAAERSHFVSLITQLLETSAYPNASRFFSTFKVDIVGEEADGPRRVVRTNAIRPEGGAVSINYVLEPSDKRWIIEDVILDRQSLAASVTSQIQATLKKSSYQDLVAQLESRLKQAQAAKRD